MAQRIMLMSSTYSLGLKKDPLLQLESQRLWPKFYHLSFNPIPSNSINFSSSTFTTSALFKQRPKPLPKSNLYFARAIGALGDRGKFVDDEPATGLDKAVIPPGKGFKELVVSNKESNELLVGRLAQLGFAFSLIGEIVTGKGALAQLNIETGLPINEIEPLVLFNVLFFFIAALNPGTAKFVTDEEEN
ncbi:unnamed protein product [Lupinus luteus]|uniref:Photosystem II 22 kDa protein, chloroplastic n=1 Tax=Lupinus luteus TaxID=3873 RepID=A0AAV1Y0J7_LUPLU